MNRDHLTAPVQGGVFTTPVLAIAGNYTALDDREAVTPVIGYIVHEAGELQADGSQRCRRCGWVILDAPPPGVNHALWGFPLYRRIVQGPVCTYLVTADRQLAGDEVSCT